MLNQLKILKIKKLKFEKNENLEEKGHKLQNNSILF